MWGEIEEQEITKIYTNCLFKNTQRPRWKRTKQQHLNHLSFSIICFYNIIIRSMIFHTLQMHMFFMMKISDTIVLVIVEIIRIICSFTLQIHLSFIFHYEIAHFFLHNYVHLVIIVIHMMIINKFWK